ncbi:leucine-rich repeat protein [Leyella stercorea]
MGCKTLTNIGIPQSVTTIKKGAFYGCKSLPTYMIFDIIQRFGKEAFDS